MLCSLPILCAFTLLTTGMSLTNEGQPQVFRTFMPGAGPSAFGVVLSPQLALCYDPLRGGVNQAWQGTLDLAPTRRAKINQPAQINGTVFYKETTMQPLRVHDAGKVPERRFKGYAYGRSGDGVTFKYTLDGVEISESLRVTADGRGIERLWNVPSGAVFYLVTDPQANADVTIQGGTEVSRGTWKHVGASNVLLSMKIQPHH